MTLKALIFDVDGTLADTEKNGHRVAYNRAFDLMNIPWHWSIETYGKLLAVTGGKERMKHFVQNYHPDLPPNSDLEKLIQEIYETKSRIFGEMLMSGLIPLRCGVERLFREAMAAGLKLAIATTTNPGNVTALLTSTLGKESIDWFEIIAAGDMVEHKKPSPEIYQLVLDDMQMTADQCVALEDSENGCVSACAAGIPVIATISEYTRDEPFSCADLVLDQLGDEQQAATVIRDSSATFNSDMLSVEYLFQRYGG
jgi:beta-phosphoglucomutase-like phosphatase (HAD superfamily)